jgi:hypothetical protein
MFLIHSIDKGIFLVLGWLNHRHQNLSSRSHDKPFSSSSCMLSKSASCLILLISPSRSRGILSIISLECSTAIILSGKSSDILVSQLRSETCSLTLAAELGPFFKPFALAFLLIFYDLAQLLCLIL